MITRNEIIATLTNKQTDSYVTIQKSPYEGKHRYNQRSQQENLQKNQIQQNQTKISTNRT